jgi:hypothetical protein
MFGAVTFFIHAGAVMPLGAADRRQPTHQSDPVPRSVGDEWSDDDEDDAWNHQMDEDSIELGRRYLLVFVVMSCMSCAVCCFTVAAYTWGRGGGFEC